MAEMWGIPESSNWTLTAPESTNGPSVVVTGVDGVVGVVVLDESRHLSWLPLAGVLQKLGKQRGRPGL